MRVSEASLALITRVNAQGGTEYLTQWNEKWRAYSLIGGHREEGESFRECCIREVEEELGLKRDVDFTVAADPMGPTCQYVAFSKSAEEQTTYRIELFPVLDLTFAAASEVNNNPNNRWLTMQEIRAGQSLDGKAVAEQVIQLLRLHFQPHQALS